VEPGATCEVAVWAHSKPRLNAMDTLFVISTIDYIRRIDFAESSLIRVVRYAVLVVRRKTRTTCSRLHLTRVEFWTVRRNAALHAILLVVGHLQNRQ